MKKGWILNYSPFFYLISSPVFFDNYHILSYKYLRDGLISIAAVSGNGAGAKDRQEVTIDLVFMADG